MVRACRPGKLFDSSEGSRSRGGSPAADKAPKPTRAQQNALRAAQNYLDTMPFSKAGFIEQLSSEHGSQFTKAQAVYAVNQLGL